MSTPAARVLVVDDDAGVRESLDLCLRYEGFEVECVGSGAEALDRLDREPADLVLLDVKMPGVDGMEVLSRLHARFPTMPVVMISGHADIRMAVEAIQRGADDFLEKPLDANRTVVVARNAVRRRALERVNRRLREALDRDLRWVGTSPASERVIALADRVARSDERVLIVGETGVGKELLARRIHAASPRRDGPFEVLPCAALAPELVEDQLFGHVAGAFSGAVADHAGALERAAEGTLVLDEVGEMPLEAQGKALRALETGEWLPLGAAAPRRADVRILATTRHDLRALARSGSFREDLYFRLGVVVIAIPPLRERSRDVEPLVHSFLDEASRRARGPRKRIEPAALRVLTEQAWRGNAREVRNAVDALTLLAEGDSITEADVREYLASRSTAPDPFAAKTMEEFRAAADRLYLGRQIALRNGNMKRTAEELGISRANLYRMLERLGMKAPPGAGDRGEGRGIG